MGDHRKELEAKDVSRFTRQSKKSAEEQLHKSAITDHVTRENHVIDWNQVKVNLTAEPDGSRRQLQSANAKTKK